MCLMSGFSSLLSSSFFFFFDSPSDGKTSLCNEDCDALQVFHTAQKLWDHWGVWPDLLSRQDFRKRVLGVQSKSGDLVEV